MQEVLSTRGVERSWARTGVANKASTSDAVAQVALI
jgi:hypothetical protein